MATLSLSMTTNQGTISRSVSLSDVNADRLIEWAKATYGLELTNAQAFRTMADAVFNGIKANVLAHERVEAERNAAAQISDIGFT